MPRSRESVPLEASPQRDRRVRWRPVIRRSDRADTVPAIDGEALAAAVDTLRMGLTPEAQASALREIAAGSGAVPAQADVDPADVVREAALRAIPREPELRNSLLALEEWLEGEVDAAAALPVAAEWSLPAAELDLETAVQDARAYIEAYPFEGRVIGNLGERCANWLAQRMAMTVVPAERLPAVRRAISPLADAATPEFPTAAASVHAVAATVSDDALWHHLALCITQWELDRKGW